MKKKLRQSLFIAFAGAIISLSMFAGQIKEVRADDSHILDVGDSVDLKADGVDGVIKEGNTDVSTSTSGGASRQETTAELNAYEEKTAARDMLKDWISDAKADAGDLVYGVTEGTSITLKNDIINIGFTDVNREEIVDFMNLINSFKENIGVGDKYADAYDKIYGRASKVLPTDSSLGEIDASILWKIKQNVALKNNFVAYTYKTKMFSFDFISSTGLNVVYDREGVTPMGVPGSIAIFHPGFAINGVLNEWSTDHQTHIRPDLILGGLNDAETWSDRFTGFDRVISNAMIDYVVLGYLEDYHIYSVQKDCITNIDYTSDLRRWVIYKNGVQVGEPMYTENPQHEFRFTSPEPGEYTIRAEQEAVYTKGTYVKYDVCTYLFDAETKNILYFTEKLVTDGKGGSIVLDEVTETGFAPTGDVFNITVNDLGQIVTDGAATERVE